MSNDPKEFWKKLNLKRRAKAFDFTKPELYNYFKKLASHDINSNVDDQSENLYQESKTTINEEMKEISDAILNCQFTIDKIKARSLSSNQENRQELIGSFWNFLKT